MTRARVPTRRAPPRMWITRHHAFACRVSRIRKALHSTTRERGRGARPVEGCPLGTRCGAPGDTSHAATRAYARSTELRPHARDAKHAHPRHAMWRTVVLRRAVQRRSRLQIQSFRLSRRSREQRVTNVSNCVCGAHFACLMRTRVKRLCSRRGFATA